MFIGLLLVAGGVVWLLSNIGVIRACSKSHVELKFQNSERKS